MIPIVWSPQDFTDEIEREYGLWKPVSNTEIEQEFTLSSATKRKLLHNLEQKFGVEGAKKVLDVAVLAVVKSHTK